MMEYQRRVIYYKLLKSRVKQFIINHAELLRICTNVNTFESRIGTKNVHILVKEDVKLLQDDIDIVLKS